MNVTETTIEFGGVQVFTTDIKNRFQEERLLRTLEKSFPELEINFDLWDYLSNPEMPYPCGHSILRVQGNTINSKSIISTINQSGFKCDILENKVCNQ